MASASMTLPFDGPDVFLGLGRCSGLAKASSEELTLEFVLKDSVFELLQSGVKEIHIPKSEIDVIRLTQGWFGAKLRLRLKSMKWLAELPGCERGEVTLRVARRDRARAAEFAQVLGAS